MKVFFLLLKCVFIYLLCYQNLMAQDFFDTYHEAFIEVNPYVVSGVEIPDISLSTKPVKSVNVYAMRFFEWEDNSKQSQLKKIKKQKKHWDMEVEYDSKGRVQRLNTIFNPSMNELFAYANEYHDSLIIRRFFKNGTNNKTYNVIINNGKVIRYDGKGISNLQFFYRDDGLLDYVLYGDEKKKWQYVYKDSLGNLQIDIMIDKKLFRRYIYDKEKKLISTHNFLHLNWDVYATEYFFYHAKGMLALTRDSIFVLNQKNELRNMSYYNYDDEKKIISKLDVNSIDSKYPNFPDYKRTYYYYNKYRCLIRKIVYSSVYGGEKLDSIEEYEYKYY